MFLLLTLTCNCRLGAISIYTVNNWIVALEDCIEPVYDVKNIIKNNKVKLAEYASKLHCNLFRHLDSVNKILPLEKRLSSDNCSKMCLIQAPNDRQRMSYNFKILCFGMFVKSSNSLNSSIRLAGCEN